MWDLGECAAIAQIATAIATAAASAKYILTGVRQRWRLENYLRDVKESGKGHGDRSITHLMSRVGLTEAQILDAAFRSKNIGRVTLKDPNTGLAQEILLSYSGRIRQLNTTD